MPRSKRRKPAAAGKNGTARTRAAITKHGNIWAGLSLFKATADPDDIRRVLPDLLQQRAYANLVWPNPKPRTFREYGGAGLRIAPTLEQELTWASTSFLPHVSNLNQFLEFRRRYETKFLIGDYDSLESELTAFEDGFGVSLWLAEARINLLQMTRGYEAQKAYTRDVLHQMTKAPIARYLLGLLSYRSEQNVSAQSFEQSLMENLAEEEGFAAFTLLSVGLAARMDGEVSRKALVYTDTLPLIDRYLSFVKILHASAAAQDESIDSIEIIARTTNALTRRLSDPALRRLQVVCGNSQNLEADTTNVLDMYSAGRYDDVIDASSRSIQATGSIDSLQLLLRARQHLAGSLGALDLPEHASLKTIADDLEHIVSYSEDGLDAANRLAKIRLMNAGSAWAANLGIVLLQQQVDPRVQRPTLEQVVYAFGALEDNPALSFIFEELGRGTSYIRCAYHGVTSTTNEIISALLEGKPHRLQEIREISPTRRLRLTAIHALRAEDAPQAVELLGALADHPLSNLDAVELQILLAFAHLQGKNLHACADICSSLLLKSSYFVKVLPVCQLVDGLLELQERADDFEPAILGQLSVLIILDFQARYLGTSEETKIDAFQDFLAANRVELASQLHGRREQFPSAEYGYFLRFICVADVIDRLLNLSSTREVEDERARIIVQCTESSSNDQISQGSLLEELRAIRTAQAIRETRLQLDQSKIYVNVDGIKKVIGNSIGESWSRYRIISLRDSAEPEFLEIQRALEQALGQKVAVFRKNVTDSEQGVAFTRMVTEIRDKFAESKEFGLNSNLSTNIRHGSIMRELRKPFLSQNLVTNKPTQTAEYQPNVYWIDRSNLKGSRRAALRDALNRLAHSVDAVIEDLNQNLLRIRSPSAPEGLFDFTLTHRQIQGIKRLATDVADSDEFIDLVLGVLWQRTGTCLQFVREVLREKTLRLLMEAIATLQMDLDELGEFGARSSLLDATNLIRPEVSSAVDRVAAWFTLSDKQEYLDYPIQVAFDAALAYVKSYPSNTQITTTLVGDWSLKMAGSSLPHLTRIFSIILENAAVHSGVSSGELQIMAEISSYPDMIHLKFENSLGGSTDFEQLEAKVCQLNSEFGRDRAAELVGIEGGSGYPKIWKILRHDLGREHELSVSVTANRWFSVELIMDTRGVIA